MEIQRSQKRQEMGVIARIVKKMVTDRLERGSGQQPTNLLRKKKERLTQVASSFPPHQVTTMPIRITDMLQPGGPLHTMT